MNLYVLYVMLLSPIATFGSWHLGRQVDEGQECGSVCVSRGSWVGHHGQGEPRPPMEAPATQVTVWHAASCVLVI